jgi:flagellar protein FliL
VSGRPAESLDSWASSQGENELRVLGISLAQSRGGSGLITPVEQRHMSDTAKAPTEPKKKGGMNRLLIVAGVVVVLGGGGAAAFFKMRAPAAAEESDEPEEHGKAGKGEKHGKADAKKKKKKKAETEPGLVTLEPFVVNLADQGGGRFLRLSARLVVDSPEVAEKIQKNDVLIVRLRSSILELLTEQTADQLVTAEGKATLKTAIAEHVEPLMEEAEVTDVLFSDFVVQF